MHGEPVEYPNWIVFHIVEVELDHLGVHIGGVSANKTFFSIPGECLPGAFFLWICIVANWVSVDAGLLLNICIHQEDPRRAKQMTLRKGILTVLLYLPGAKDS